MATKEYSVKPTHKQVEAFRIMSENVSMSKTEAFKRAGYAPEIAKQPNRIIETKGFQQLMEEAGLTDEFLNNALKEDIEAKPANRKAELELAYKLKGRLKDSTQESGTTLNVTNIMNFIDNRGSGVIEGMSGDFVEGETL